MVQKTEDQGGPAADTVEKDSPLLDLTDQSVKKLLKLGKQRGYVTHDELNAVLPSEEVTPDAIEDTMAMLNEMGISFVEQEETDEATAADEEPDEEDNRSLVVNNLPAKSETRKQFEKEFLAARRRGDVEFMFRGRPISTRRADETGEKHRERMKEAAAQQRLDERLERYRARKGMA